MTVFAAGIMAYLIWSGRILLNNPSKTRYPVRGVDVSHYQGDIDWGAFVKHPGYEFIARTEWYDFDYKDILLQATKYSAEIAKLDDQLGTIKEGKNAELVVVEGNPDEDIYVMKKLPKYVFYNGEIIEN